MQRRLWEVISRSCRGDGVLVGVLVVVQVVEVVVGGQASWRGGASAASLDVGARYSVGGAIGWAWSAVPSG